MKQMHNLRLVAADPLELCRYPSDESALPQRLQTDMSLYSNHLSGLVLLTDGRLAVHGGRAGQVWDLCQRSSELHFPSFEAQLQSVREEHLGRALAWRAERRRRRAAEVEVKDKNEDVHTKYARDANAGLRAGDFYVTRHSNLCELHVLFHVVTEEGGGDGAAALSSGAINSRHPVVMGLRNVLRSASLSDVSTLTLPLLLSHEMTEAMTVQWCMRRAELVFKCVKGFMMEVASWGGSEIRTLQFLVPTDIDREVFARLTSMLAGIFRTSNPIRT